MTNAQTRMEHVEKWLSHHALFASALNGSDIPTLKPLRQQAILKVEKLGFPTTKHEEWKYTSVLPLLKREFSGAFLPSAQDMSQLDTSKWLIDGLESHVIVLVNGFYVPALSSIRPEADGIWVGSLLEAFKAGNSTLQAHFGRLADAEDEVFIALNTAFVQDGVCIIVPNGKALQFPVQIVNVQDGQEVDRFSGSRNFAFFGKNSEGTVFEQFISLGNHATWTNRVTEVVVEDDARVDWITLQNDHTEAHLINQMHVSEGRQSNFSSTVVTLNGGMVRNNLTIRLNGEHSEGHMHGLYLTQCQTHVDNHTLVDHAVPNCYSNELYKGVMDGESTGVFNGKIIVRPDAQKTNAFQSNKNVLLSEKATINTKPQLEIFADDVKCSHGATIGRLDEDALFYIRTRGLGEKDAKALLTLAFASEVATFIKHEQIRAAVDHLIAERLWA